MFPQRSVLGFTIHHGTGFSSESIMLGHARAGVERASKREVGLNMAVQNMNPHLYARTTHRCLGHVQEAPEVEI